MKNFNLKKISMMGLAAMMAVSAMSVSVFAFDDIRDDYLNTVVGTLANLSVIEGYDDGTFRPETNVTRSEMAAFIRRTMNGKNEIGNIGGYKLTAQGIYTDMSDENWALDPIMLLSRLGIINGYDNGTFMPDGSVTYNEAVKMLVCDLNYGYEAEKNGGYPTGYIYTAERLGILNGINNTEYSQHATRGDIAVMIYNSLDIPRALVSEYSIKNGASYMTADNNTIRNILEGADTITDRGGVVPSEGMVFSEEIHRMKDQSLIHVSNADGKSNIYIGDNNSRITVYFTEIPSGIDYYIHLDMLDDETVHEEQWFNIGPITTDTFTISDIPKGHSYQMRLSSSPSYSNISGKVIVE